MFDVDDIVFARYTDYPIWPAKVILPTQDQLRDLGENEIPSNKRVVLFFNDGGAYACIDIADLRPIDDPRLQKKTRAYDGPYSTKLRVAFKAALKEHRPSESDNIPRPSPATSHTHRKRRKKPAPSQPSHPTSPVTGHSDLRQSAPSRRTDLAIKPSNSPAPPETSSKRRSTSRSSIPPTVTSRTNPSVSVSTPPSRSPQSSTVPVPVKLRVRHKRSSAAMHALQSPHSDSSSPSPMQTLSQSSPKRSRPDTNTQPNYVNQSQTEQSNGKDLDPPKGDIPTALANAPRETTRPQTGTDPARKSEKLSADLPVTGKRSRISRSSSVLHSRHENDNPKILRDSQIPAKTDPLKPGLDSENTADKAKCVGKRHRSSRFRTAELSHSDDESDANGTSSSEREEQSTDIRSSRTRGKSRRVNGRDRVQNNTAKRESDYGEKPSKRRKTDESRGSGSLAFEMLSKKDSSELIEGMMNTIRFLHVEKWQDGYKRAGVRDIVKTEKEMSARCKAAIQKVEKLLRIMKGEQKRDKPEATAEELEAFQAVRDMREIYFDVKTMNLRKVGPKMMSLGRELGQYSTKVSSAIRDVLVMWADLTTEDVNESVKKKDERTAVKKEKRNSYRTTQGCRKDEKKVVETDERTAMPKEKGKSYRKIRERKKEDEEDDHKVDETDERTAMAKEKGKSHRKIRECKKEDEEDDQKVVETGGGITDNKRRVSAENGKVLTNEAGDDKKERSAREERLMKFDPKKVVGAVDEILAGAQEELELDDRERTRFTREVEEAIEPRFEDDRSGYYEASVKVMKAFRRALKNLKTHGTGDTNTGIHPHTKMLVDSMHDETGEKARLLVARLLG